MSLDAFWAGLPFEPDDFQVEAAKAIEAGDSVVVTAPTGAGKTLVAEVATHFGRAEGKRVFYTTPIKALSNQKFVDLTETYTDVEVGLLTGDNVINPEAPVIVATLEVLRNMIYANPAKLDDVATVILDEAHYLQDPSRGAAWEEVIIHCPGHVRFVCLSATIANNLQFAEWVQERRGPTTLVNSEERPVPLEPMYMIKERTGARSLHLLPMFTTRDGRQRPNSRLEHMVGLERGRRRRFKTPRRLEVVEELDSASMLPVIYFIFSRAGCDSAAMHLAESGLRLTTPEDRERIRDVVDERTSHLTDADLAVLGYDRWVGALECGVAAHHAGLVPAFKETVEILFRLGLVKAVFATETLALGINMPARSVVIENLSKFNGESHELLQPGDFTQLTGRAGRRGIDVKGYGVVLHSPFVDLRQMTEIASMGSHELRSSFRPTYNMTANLVANYGEEQARELLEASFAAFQEEDSRADAHDRIEALRERLADETAQSKCELGSVEEYLGLVEAAGPARRESGVSAELGPGVVVDVNGGARDGRYVVLKRLAGKNGAERFLVLSTSGRISTIGRRQIPKGSDNVASIELPQPFRPRDRRFVNQTVRKLRRLPPRTGERSSPSHMDVDHPVAECPDAAHHVSALRRARRLRNRLEQQRHLLRSSGAGLVDQFEAIRALLGELDHLQDWSLTTRGKRLRMIYNESDLLVAESVEHGVLHGLEMPELASLVSTFVYEPRSDHPSAPDWPTEALARRWEELVGLWANLTKHEGTHSLSPTRRPDPGFGRVAFEWASGVPFDDLSTAGLAPGDFVRLSRQVVDLLRQLRDAVQELRSDAHAALKAVDRGVVAAQGVG